MAGIDAYFIDDSVQTSCSREKMNAMIAIGGFCVKAEVVGLLNRAIEKTCDEYGFSQGEEFKWSPGRELWMRSNLVGEGRASFYRDVLALLSQNEARVTVVAAEMTASSATGAPTPLADTTTLFVERADNACTRRASQAFLITDRPNGSRQGEDQYLADTLQVVLQGTKYVSCERILHSVLVSPSKFSRLLQAADLITSCSLAMISGETRHAPETFQHIRPLFQEEMGRIGGIGLKIHPDFKFANLYHWLVGDTHFWRANCGRQMPLPEYPYCRDPSSSIPLKLKAPEPIEPTPPKDGDFTEQLVPENEMKGGETDGEKHR